ncbi:MAG: O-methyltransferase [Tepidibacillus sp.]
MSFLNEEVEQYLTQLMPIEDPLLYKIQQEGLAQEIPIIQVPSIRLIQLFLQMIKPKTIIEVGTAIGFSTIWLAQAAPDATIHTIERKASMAAKAREHFRQMKLDKQIILHEGEAIQVIPTLPQADFIFIDAAKGKYKEFFHLTFPLLKVGGVFVFDNVLFRGYVADPIIAETKPMLRKIRDFNDFIATFPKLSTSFIPIGDGLAVCYKTEE